MVSASWTAETLIRQFNPYIDAGDDVVEMLLNSASTRPTDDAVEDAWRQPAVKAALEPLVTRLRELVEHPPGIVFLSIARQEELDDQQLTFLSYLIASRLGLPLVQNDRRERVVIVRDERPADTANSRGYVTRERMLLHTDPFDVACLTCLSSAARGGENMFACARTILEVMTMEHPDLVDELYKTWAWDIGRLGADLSSATITSPIFSLHNGHLSCRYGSSMLRRGTLQTKTAEHALDAFEEIGHRASLSFRTTLARGSSVWFNNFTVLHGREAFEDELQTSQVRRLVRLWIRLRSREKLAPEFAAFDDQLFDQRGISQGT